MVLINKRTKLSSQMAPMPINDIYLIKQIRFSSAKVLLYGVNEVHFSNDHNIYSSLIRSAGA